MAELNKYFEQNRFMSSYEEISGFIDYVSCMNDGYILPRYPEIQKQARTFFFSAIRNNKPALLDIALAAGVSEKEFFNYEANMSRDVDQGFDMYMYMVSEIVDNGFQKQTTEICFLKFLAQVLAQMARFYDVSHSMYVDFKTGKERLSYMRRSAGERDDLLKEDTNALGDDSTTTDEYEDTAALLPSDKNI